MALDPQSEVSASANPRSRFNFLFMTLAAATVALLWVLLYHLNEWMFAATSISVFINWIFLPAALRMLAIMACDWIGAVGLFIGAMVTNQADPAGGLSDGLIIAFLSATGPLVAFWCCTKLLKLSTHLIGLTARQLLVFAAIGALFNAVPHNIYFYLSGRMSSPLEGLAPMFLGDLFGTLITLYVVSLVLRLVFSRSSSAQA